MKSTVIGDIYSNGSILYKNIKLNIYMLYFIGIYDIISYIIQPRTKHANPKNHLNFWLL